jgi:murein DD-endopeptidase MepM/ murein hydrolase activator NlpD
VESRRPLRTTVVVGAAVALIASSAARATEPGSQTGGAATSAAAAVSRPAFAWALARRVPAVRSWLHARPSLCAEAHTPGSYPWPLEPFDRQHPIRAFFGDPRTVFRNGDDAEAGSFSFHNGVDIVAADAAPVYPVVSGTVTAVRPDEIVVTADSGRRIFQYWHLRATVHRGERVRAAKTMLGTVRPGRGHVHLTEIDDGVVENPLQPGHLTPYRDTHPPTVEQLYVRDQRGRPLNPAALSGSIELTAAAYDIPPLPLAVPWTGVTLTPARVSWRLATRAGRQLLPEQTPVDFSRTIPPTNAFWSVYSEGTYQNFPVVGQRYLYGTPGDYLFDLTPSVFDTRLVPPGPYRFTVTAEDTCGNRGSLGETIRILPQPALRPLHGSVLRTSSSRWPRRFWTVVIATLPVGLDAARAVSSHDAWVEARVAPVGVLVTIPSHRHGLRRDLIIAGVYRSWAEAYTAAQQAAPRFQGAYARAIVQPVHRRPRVPERLPRPGSPIAE